MTNVCDDDHVQMVKVSVLTLEPFIANTSCYIADSLLQLHVCSPWYKSVISLSIGPYVIYTALGLRLSVYESV